MPLAHNINLDELILGIHAAPLEETRWSQVVDGLRSAVGAERALLFSVPVPGQVDAFWHVSAEIDPASTRDYALEFAREDVWMAGVRRMRLPVLGRSFTGEELIERGDFLRSRYYGEFLHRYGIGRLLTVMLREPICPGAAPGATFSFYRALRAEPFGESENGILKRVAPHLVLALETFWRLKALSIQNKRLSQTLDAVNAAVFLIDRSGRLMFENDAGADSCRREEVFVLRDGYLAPAASVRETRRVSEVLQAVRSGRVAQAQVTVARRLSPTLLCGAPLAATNGPFVGACGMLWLTQFARPTGVRRVSELFLLTRAEERLLGALCDGRTLDEASDLFQLSIHTVRGQLKTIQRKTGWHTQAELVRQTGQLGLIDPAAAEQIGT
jgi:DNA-binding CsgD family transcriptional regulator/PAS domain-containing protein